LHAFEVVAVFSGVAGIEGVAVGAEVLDEIGGEFVGAVVGWTWGLILIPHSPFGILHFFLMGWTRSESVGHGSII
jgi:hypothetical protein